MFTVRGLTAFVVKGLTAFVVIRLTAFAVIRLTAFAVKGLTAFVVIRLTAFAVRSACGASGGSQTLDVRSACGVSGGSQTLDVNITHTPKHPYNPPMWGSQTLDVIGLLAVASKLLAQTPKQST